MIDFESLLPRSRVMKIESPSSQKSVLQIASRLIAENNDRLSVWQILDGLLDRERLGSTAIDDSGVAIPHCRVAECDEPIGVLLHLDRPVDFGGHQVDILFVLVVARAEHRMHLDILGVIARVFIDEDVVDTLRQTDSNEELHETFQRLLMETVA